MVNVAQLGRAPDCGSGGRGFDPHRSPQLKNLLVQCLEKGYCILQFSLYVSGRSAIGSALVLGARGCQFESGRPDQLFLDWFFLFAYFCSLFRMGRS